MKNRAIYLLSILFLLCLLANCGTVFSVTASLSTPIIDGTKVEVPYILSYHGERETSNRYLIDVTIEIRIRTKNITTNIIKTYNASDNSTIEDGSRTQTGTIIIQIPPDETYIIGSAEVVEVRAVDNTTF